MTDISKVMKKNLKEDLQHHSVKQLDKDLHQMEKKHPEAQKLGDYNKDHASEEHDLEEQTELNHWGLPRH